MHSLEIRKWNIPAHIDIEDDIKKRQNGRITFTLRFNAGNIVDYNLVEYIDPRTKYINLKPAVIQELTITHFS